MSKVELLCAASILLLFLALAPFPNLRRMRMRLVDAISAVFLRIAAVFYRPRRPW